MGTWGLPRLIAAVSMAEATASVAYTWATAAEMAAVSFAFPWPRYLTASAASSAALLECSGIVISPPQGAVETVAVHCR